MESLILWLMPISPILAKIVILPYLALLMGVNLLPMVCDYMIVAAVLFAFLYGLVRLASRAFPEMCQWEDVTLSVITIISLPLAYTRLGDAASALVMQGIASLPDGSDLPILWIIATAWVTVAAVLLWRLVSGLWLVQRWVGRLPAAPVDHVFAEALALSGNRPGIRVRTSGPDGVVASWGLWRRSVIVPDDFMERYGEAERRTMYLHELAHLRRGDSWRLLLVAFARCCIWFNPLASRAMCTVNRAVEIACDRAVLAVPGVDRFRYAELILEAQASSAPLAPGFSAGTGSEVKARIQWIVGFNLALRSRLVMLAVFLAVTVASALTLQYGYRMDRELDQAMQEVQIKEKPQVIIGPDGKPFRVTSSPIHRGAIGYYGKTVIECEKEGDE